MHMHTTCLVGKDKQSNKSSVEHFACVGTMPHLPSSRTSMHQTSVSDCLSCDDMDLRYHGRPGHTLFPQHNPQCTRILRRHPCTPVPRYASMQYGSVQCCMQLVPASSVAVARQNDTLYATPDSMPRHKYYNHDSSVRTE